MFLRIVILISGLALNQAQAADAPAKAPAKPAEAAPAQPAAERPPELMLQAAPKGKRETPAVPDAPSAIKLEKDANGQSKKEFEDREAPDKRQSTVFLKNSGGNKEAKARADKLRLTALASMRTMLKQKGLSDNRKYELLLRSGEIYLERSDYIQELEIEKFTVAYDKWEKTKKGKAPVASYQTSKKQLDLGINIFKTLVSKYPKHPRTDTTYYALGTALARIDNADSIKYFNLLLKNHPKSVLLPDAYLSLGEYYFDKNNVAEAIGNYKKVLKYPQHKAYIYAKYKLGWSYYNSPATSEGGQEKNWQMAAKEFKDVIKLSSLDRTDQSRLSLRDEALNDLVMVWADLNAVEEAWAYFSALKETDKFYNMLERLGWIYLDQGKYDRAMIVYERLIKEAPLRASSPKIHTRLLELYDRKGSSSQVVALLSRMVEFYRVKGKWATANAKDMDAVKDSRVQLELHVHRYGAMYHDRAQKSQDSNYYLASERLYKLHLKEFPQSKNHIEIMYYLSELLYDEKKLEESSDFFHQVATLSPADGKYKKKSADSMVDVANEAVMAAKLPAVPKAGSIAKPMQIPKIQVKLVDRIASFIKLYPEDTRVAKMKYTSAKIHFDYGHYDTAIKGYAEIAQNYPATVEGRLGARTVMTYYHEKKDWVNTIRFANAFLKVKNLMDKDLLSYTTSVLRNANFQLAVQYEKDGEFQKAGDQYLVFQQIFPKDPEVDKAVFNAIVNYYNAKNIDSALATSEFFLSLYTTSTLRSSVMQRLAANYEKLVDLPKASKYYYMFHKEFPNDPKRKDALFNAATLQRGMSAVPQSVAYFEEYIRMYPNSEDAVDAMQQIADMLERNGDFAQAVVAYDKLAVFPKANVDLRYFAQTKSAMISYRNLSKPAAKATLDKIGDNLIRDSKVSAYQSREMIAKMWFDALEPRFNQYQKVEIVNSLKIESEAQSKQAALTALVNDYKHIVDLRNSEYMAAALYRVAQMHENFSRIIATARTPAGFTEDEAKDFRAQLEEGSKPLLAQANGYYVKAFERTKEIDSYSPWVRTINDKMATLDAKKYKSMKEESSEPFYLGHNFVAPTVLQKLVSK